MSRVELPLVVKSTATGLPFVGAAVTITQRATGAPVTWYTSENAGTPSTAAIITDANGRALAWVARGAYTITVSGTGLTPISEPWDAMPGSDLGGDSLWLADGAVTNAKVATAASAAKFTTGTLPVARITAGSVPGAALANLGVAASNLAAGTGSRLIAASTLTGGSIGPNPASLLASGSVTSTGKAGWGVALQIHRPTSSDGKINFGVYKDNVAVDTTSNTWISSGGISWMLAIVFSYTAPTAGSHLWEVEAYCDIISGVQGISVIDGTGIFLLFENV